MEVFRVYLERTKTYRTRLVVCASDTEQAASIAEQYAASHDLDWDCATEDVDVFSVDKEGDAAADAVNAESWRADQAAHKDLSPNHTTGAGSAGPYKETTMEWHALSASDRVPGMRPDLLYDNCVEIYIDPPGEIWVTAGHVDLVDAVTHFVETYDLTDRLGARVEVTRYANGEAVEGRDYHL